MTEKMSEIKLLDINNIIIINIVGILERGLVGRVPRMSSVPREEILEKK